jgi:hypothetical protein
MFEGFLHSDKPNFSNVGIRRLHIVNEGLYPGVLDPQGRPIVPRVREIMQKLPRDGAPIVLDFEDFDLRGSDRTVAQSVGKLDRILGTFRAAAPTRQFGFYTILPVNDYWRTVKPQLGAEYRSWQRDTDRVSKPLEPKVDALFPSLYTFYEDQAGWTRNATEQICEARRISDKPVYVFLWPEYHDGDQRHRGKRIDRAYWRMQLETAYRLADGVVLWGGYDLAGDKPRRWDPREPWWQETLAFARDLERRRR